MEKELISLKKELDKLDDIEGDVWKPVNAWEKKFRLTIGLFGSKYDWWLNEFEKIKENSLKDSFRNRINCFQRLYVEIEKRES